MTVLGILHFVAPPLRRPFRWRDLLPLILFLTIFAGGCVSLELAGAVLFVRPVAFFLSIVTVWIWWLHLAGVTGLSNGRSQVALWFRLLMAAGFIVALAEPRAVRTSEVLSVVYAVDVSDSVGQTAVDSALEFVARHVSEKPATDEAGLVVFGRSAVVELPPRITFPFEGVVTSQVRRDATNLAEALSLSAAMIPATNNGRIVLISDGTSTGGDLPRRLDELRSRNIAVDVLPIDYQYENEVWLERLELPQQVKLDQDYAASVLVSSLSPASGTLVLRENGSILARSEVTLHAGLNQFSLPIRVSEPGYYEYQAAIEVPDDQDNLRQNNEVLNFVFVDGSARVLIVSDPSGDAREWQPLAESLGRAGLIVEQRGAYAFPDNSLALMPYDCVVFANVPVNALVPAQMRALHDAVRDVGTGFLMLGGPDSFGPGGYHRTPLEDVLPVSMDIEQQEILEKGALIIVLHTCEFADGNTWGKRITNQAIRVLSSQDEVGVLVFADNNEQWLFKLTPASEFPQLVTKVNAASIGDMPTFAVTMQMALQEFAGTDATVRRMLIVSDGDPTAPTDSLLAAFRQNRISVSTVAISPHGENDLAAMKRIADATGGTSYTPQNPTELPSIFVKEARTLKQSMIQEKTITPLPGTPSTLLTSLQGAPQLHGYILTSLKPRAEPVLLVPSDHSDATSASTSNITRTPLLARWRYGLGTTAAFTSDLSTRWGRDWVQWEHFDTVAEQLIASLARVRQPEQLRLWTHTSSGEAVVVVEDFANDPQLADAGFSNLAAIINGPEDYSELLPLQQVGPRRYEARIPLPTQGRYQVIARGSGGGRTETVKGGFIVSYSPEYLRFRSDPITLELIRQQTDGHRLMRNSSAEDVFGDRLPRSASRPIFDWILICLAILLPLDVAVRRVHLDWSTISWRLFRRPIDGNQTSTLGTLLQTKHDTSVRVDGAVSLPARWQPSTGDNKSSRPEGSPLQVPAPGTSATAAVNHESNSPTEAVPGENDSTTLSRLLAIKRQRQQNEPENDDDSNSVS
ncbi:MAG: VWA domain-containing protein [Planctomycetota bacterium]|nr:VWA domain-containing protein [Planctomycetota bacterium]